MALRTRPARRRLLDAAAELFYARGVNATGIDAVTARAGVARKSLYNNFSSKDDLVLAFLEERHEEWRALHRARLEETRTPRERVLAVFDAYIDHAEWRSPQGFRGCGLLNAAAELPVGAPGRAVVRAHKDEVERLLEDAVADMVSGAEHARSGGDSVAHADDAVQAELAPGLAEHLSFLVEGAVTKAGLDGTTRRLVRARRLAAQLIGAPSVDSPRPHDAPQSREVPQSREIPHSREVSQ
ncbi:TetR/AcrR family transcriptional regulator [Brevibacterium yomogidense]|uniref:TetR/AcrR family transcriptional regulator n=1 Tax=Brevibacterium yomogidense TaxID=946573 RepID=UPI0018DFB854|nr:TetR/AcrR family transcriptional regulator [Brevibacterium yomogidense]